MNTHFKHQAALIKSARKKLKLSQGKLASTIGQCDQVISNFERAKAGVPLRLMSTLCEALQLPYQDMKEAMLRDYGEQIDSYLYTPVPAPVPIRETIILPEMAPSEAV